jgi:hypothetical protein
MLLFCKHVQTDAIDTVPSVCIACKLQELVSFCNHDDAMKKGKRAVKLCMVFSPQFSCVFLAGQKLIVKELRPEFILDPSQCLGSQVGEGC